MRRPLYVMIGCDCDHDRPRFNKRLAPEEIAWEGYSRLWDNFNRVREAVVSETGLAPALTAHIRADEQVYQAAGNHAFCFQLYRQRLFRQAATQDEVSWHHHQWRWQSGRWTQELLDDAWMVRNIQDSYAAIAAHEPTTLHTGWCYQNTSTMNAYNDVGVRIDTSALPGGASLHGETSRCDYRACEPQKIYIPDRRDYQTAAAHPENQLLEIPTTTVNYFWLQLATHVNNVLVGRFCRENLTVRRSFVQINAHGKLFRPFVRKFFQQQPETEFFSTYFHADELLPDEQKSSKARGLYACAHFAGNLIYLVKLARAYQREVRFCSVSEFANVSQECEREYRRVDSQRSVYPLSA